MSRSSCGTAPGAPQQPQHICLFSALLAWSPGEAGSPFPAGSVRGVGGEQKVQPGDTDPCKSGPPPKFSCLPGGPKAPRAALQPLGSSGPSNPQGSHIWWLLPPRQGLEAASPGRGLVECGGRRRGKAAPAALPRTRTCFPHLAQLLCRPLRKGLMQFSKPRSTRKGTKRGKGSFASRQEQSQPGFLLQPGAKLARHTANATTSHSGLSQLPKLIFAPWHSKTPSHGLLHALPADRGTARGAALALPKTKAPSSSTAHQHQSSSKI